jgi:hypothetical protein
MTKIGRMVNASGGSALPFYPRRLYAAFGLLVLAGALYVIGFQPSVNVTHDAKGLHQKTLWVWLDYISVAPNIDDGEGRFEGRLLLPASHILWIENTAGADLVLTLNGREVYHGGDTARLTLDSSLPAVVPFQLDYSWNGAFPPQGHIALALEGIAGIRTVVAPWSLVAGDIPADFDLLHVIRILFLLVGLAALVVLTASLRLSRRSWWIMAAVLGLSLAVHLISLSEKFANDPGVWTMTTIYDNYVLMGRGWLAGATPIGGQVYQQGNFIYLGLLQQIIGPNLQGLYLFNTIVGSFGAIFALLAGWALFDWQTGTLAGVMTALFAPLIHYQQTLQVVAPSVLFMCMLAATVAGLYRWRQPLFAVTSGILIGLAGVFQGTILVLGALPLLALLMQNASLRAKAAYGALVVISAALTIMPITVTNFNAGFHVLTANLADYQMFRSNNRDSTGMNTYMTQSEQLAMARGDNVDWLKALQRDVARNPLHIAELTVRRVALFWDSNEHSDSGMTDYVTTGVDVSLTLRFLSLAGQANFRILMSLALVGVVLGVRVSSQRRTTLLVGAGVALYIAALALFYVIGRVRAPVAPFVILLAALGVVSGYRLLRERRRSALLWLAATLVGVLAVALLMDTLVNNLPRPELVSASQLPAELVATQSTYNDEIKLLGYAFYDTNAKPGGYVTFELYWQALRQPSHDYVVTVRFINTRTQSIDTIDNYTLGAQGAPVWTSTQWHPGDILDEQYLIKLPEKPAPDAPAYKLMIGLYAPEDKQLATLTDANAETQDNHLRLTALSFQHQNVSAALDDQPLLGERAGFAVGGLPDGQTGRVAHCGLVRRAESFPRPASFRSCAGRQRQHPRTARRLPRRGRAARCLAALHAAPHDVAFRRCDFARQPPLGLLRRLHPPAVGNHRQPRFDRSGQLCAAAVQRTAEMI